MLKQIPKILSPELVKYLMEMGHGDELVLADANFPAHRIGQRVIRMDGHGVPVALEAILLRHTKRRSRAGLCRDATA